MNIKNIYIIWKKTGLTKLLTNNTTTKPIFINLTNYYMKLLIEFEKNVNGTRDCSIINYKGRITKKIIEEIVKNNSGVNIITKFNGYSGKDYGTLLDSKILYKSKQSIN